MGRKRGKPRKGELADMTIRPPAEPVFGLPPPEELEEVESRNEIDGDEIQVRYVKWMPSEIIVEFAIMHFTWCDGKWQQVARVDSCHPGIVHIHQLKRGSSDEQGAVRILGHVSAEGYEEVDSWYDKALTLMQDNLHEHVRRFGGDRD